jgi:glycosyltransferase involved in cell wall biosynthesis
MDRRYLKALFCARKKIHIKSVIAIDDQWHNSMRQILGSHIYRLSIKRLFDYCWISGIRQYHFARNLGYTDRRILNYLYSGQFEGIASPSPINRRFIYVGRLVESKGISKLLKAYNELSERNRGKCTLTIIGDGDLRYLENEYPDVIFKGHLTKKQLLGELKLGGILVVPSLIEQYGVIIHEGAQLGLPMLVSDCAGAANEFLIPGYNGYTFNTGDRNSLKRALMQMLNLSDLKLTEFGLASHRLSFSRQQKASSSSLTSIMEF